LRRFVRSTVKCWQAWTLCKAYRTTPSDLFNVEDSIAATYLDQAIAAFGMRIDNAIESATDKKSGALAKAAADAMLQLWLGEEAQPTKQQGYRDPAEFVGR
jgi:hypothetical protein